MSQHTDAKKPGRPKKQHKKEQYSISMYPELYTFLKSMAEKKQTSFSQLVTSIVLDAIEDSEKK